MSNEIVWSIVRNSSSFIVKRNGIAFSTEPGNLYNKNTYKYSGFVSKAIDVSSDGKNGVVVTKSKKDGNGLAKTKYTTTINKPPRATARSITNLVRHYRPDLTKAALARASALIASQKPGKPLPAKKLRGKKARSA
ncbi:60S ribosomal protein L28 [Cladochytrium replicatum]|nr:60S ribosomal protein L28 [Cladochytrium replicatum]